ncbi:MAG: hypothetical protein R3268_02755 [Acidiferrobacterales bacterium]|nr:hypothetical protein [Acidiferrobacterales bacterium]
MADSADRWEAATGVRTGYASPMAPNLELEPAPFECGAHLAWGCYNGVTNTITLDVSRPDNHLDAIILHEMGHYLYGTHHGSGDDVMAPGAPSPNYCITEHDVELVCERRACTRFQPEC